MGVGEGWTSCSVFMLFLLTLLVVCILIHFAALAGWREAHVLGWERRPAGPGLRCIPLQRFVFAFAR